MHGAWTLVSRNRNKKMAWDLPGPARRFQPMLIRGVFRMPSTVASGGQDDVDVSIDARNLPPALTKVNKPATLPPSANGHVERVLRTISKGPFQRLAVSHVSVPTGRQYASIRTFISEDGQNFAPSKKGILIQVCHVGEVIGALREVLK
jgi:hypothetical protein